MRGLKDYPWFAFSLMFILITSSAFASGENERNFASDLEENQSHVAFTPHVPIIIDGDTNFSVTAANEGWLGDGSAGNPYIIDSLEIDVDGGAGHCINIINTRVNFTISNCFLRGANTTAGAGVNLKNVTNGILIGNTLSHSQQAFYVNHSSFILIKSNTITDCHYSIQMLYSFNNIIVDNNVSHNSRGIQLLLSSDYNTVVNNTFTNDFQGITLYESDYNIITNNTISLNDQGINIIDENSNHNEIRWNSFWNNVENGYSSNSTNIFDSNYWSDYTGTDVDLDEIGDIPYYSWFNLTDNHPLMLLPNGLAFEWLEIPTDQLVEYGSRLNYTLHWRVYSLLTYPIWLNDTFNFELLEDSSLVTVCSLPVGEYGVKIEFSDGYGNILEGVFTVNVRDTTSPAWAIEPMNQFILHDAELDFQITAWDLSGIDQWVINDTTHFTTSYTHYPGGSTICIKNSSILEPGYYGLNLTVYDPYDNYHTVSFYLAVLDTSATTTLPTTSPTTSPTPSGVDPILTLLMGTGIGGIAVVIVFMVMYRKKLGVSWS